MRGYPALSHERAAWRKVSELKPGMVIAVPSDTALARHDEGQERGRHREGGDGDILWDEIVSLTHVGRESVYDLEVEGTHTFVGNRVIAHNTTTGPLGVTIENNGASTSDLNMFRIISEVGGADNVKFRVDSDGDVFADGTITATSSGTGNITAGSADLAEWYEVADESLSAGDVVAVGPDGRLVRAAPDSPPLGVVSATPGLALAYPEAAERNQELRSRLRPIALIGRVNVRVSGSPIATGDPLALSFEHPGVAEKADDPAAPLLGVALEPHGGGEGMMMIVLATRHARIVAPPLSLVSAPDLRRQSSTVSMSESSLKEPSAGTPSVADLRAVLEDLLRQDPSLLTTARDVSSGTLPAPVPAGVDLDVLGRLNANGALRVGGPAEFKGPAIFKALVEFIDRVIFRTDVEFAGRTVFPKDTAGFAVIRAGHTRVDVTFERAYEDAPVVVASVIAPASSPSAEAREKKEADIPFPPDVQYVITNRTTRGFTIVIKNTSSADLTFSWVALAVKDGRTAVSADEGGAPRSSPASPAPTPTPAPTTASAPDAPPDASGSVLPPEPAPSVGAGTAAATPAGGEVHAETARDTPTPAPAATPTPDAAPSASPAP